MDAGVDQIRWPALRFLHKNVLMLHGLRNLLYYLDVYGYLKHQLAYEKLAYFVTRSHKITVLPNTG